MGEKAKAEPEMMIEDGFADCSTIDPGRARFPCCIVWTPLPFISWLIPFIGHVGICREDGVILDFAGPNFVCVDNFAFGAVARYIQLKKEKESSISSKSCIFNGKSKYEEDANVFEELTWDDALRKGTQEYQHRSYNLFTCNCHSFVANNLNRLGVGSGGWNMVNLAAFVFFKGQWVSKASMARSFLPCVIVYGLAFALGSWNFIAYCTIFGVLLVGWFVLGTYCFKNLMQL
ncbi:PREDICTED: protein RTE1-HOMOLOG [Tarenaya hassleriana]|uniref:protein RTE1-HOMOLOG n=1 Tax=Tarenaya hassleriana TaxID=28532 RepID=UPI00053C5ED0|nr:PREDICTED: protein RTE1-HOMOLOG [Tarenaya hassleriana]XP_019058983.1 PREDICTED: protein RTE1-HOMOLOG [Tarenaya hassleriana]